MKKDRFAIRPASPKPSKTDKESFEDRVLFCTAALLALILAEVKAPTSLLVCIPVLIAVGTQLWVVDRLHRSILVQIALTTSAGTLGWETAFILSHRWIA